MVYEGGFKNGWQDYGWAPRKLLPSQPAQVNFASWGGWIVAKPHMQEMFGGVFLSLQAPSHVLDALVLTLLFENNPVGEGVSLASCTQRTHNGWLDVWCPVLALNPSMQPFDKMQVKAQRNVTQAWVQWRVWGLTPASVETTALKAPAHTGPVRAVQSVVMCHAPKKKISPWIYGIAQAPDTDTSYMQRLGATARRWGGNASSRYNGLLGDAWNTASDWYFMNVNKSKHKGRVWDVFLQQNKTMGVSSAVTLPLLGYVAKDTSSYSYPVSVYGSQQRTAPEKPDAGNGLTLLKQPLSADPLRTSVVADPHFIATWFKQMKQSEGASSLNMLFLDNEPMLWHHTHRDVHPQPVSYDELLQRTLRYGSAVRAVDAQMPIAGPSVWGWPAYFYSAVDAEAGFRVAPDRKAHGNMPLLEWYVQQLAHHAQRTGVRLLNHLDVHFYPQASGVYQNGQGEKTDSNTAALRIRSTRALWDASYQDESWIADKVMLIPRLKKIIEKYDPSLGVVIGEYHFGAMGHMSGGLAQAEALGRFAQQGVHAAYLWTHPPEGTPGHAAFRAFRKVTPEGFLPWYVESSVSDASVSVFASSNTQGDEHVWVVLNKDPHTAARVHFSAPTCGRVVEKVSVFTYTTGMRDFVEEKPESTQGTNVVSWVPPYAFQVIHVRY